jgi:hypothetical protein
MLTILLLSTLWTTESFAQGQRSKYSTAIASLKELHVESGRLDDTAQKCGLVAGDLEAPATTALETSRLRNIKSALDFIFVNANVIAVGDACTAAVDVELFRWSNEFRTSVSVWTRRALITGGRSGFNVRVREKVDTLTREFVAEWQKARQ